MPTSAPPVTIGLPVYNGERFLRQAIESIRAQTFADFSLVVCDNASTDGTVAIVEEAAADDDRIVLLRNDENRGAAWNYNRTFADCRSPYFKWAAADDMLAPAALERLVEALDDSPPRVVLAYPRTQLIDADGLTLREIDDGLATAPGAPPHVRMLRVMLKMVYGNCLYSLVRSDALRATRGHGSFPSADYVVLAELALVGEFRHVPEPLLLRRWHEGNSVQANPTKESLTRWFDPKRQTVEHPTLVLYREYLRAVQHARLRPRERLLAYAAVAFSGARRHVGFRARLRALAHGTRDD